MPRYLTLLIFIVQLLGLCVVAQAEVPLVLEETIVLPATTATYDVQHWFSDSTIGYVCATGHTLYYVKNIGEPVDTLILPSNFGIEQLRNIACLRSISAPDHAIVALVTEYTDWLGLWRIDLATGAISNYVDIGLNDFDNCGYNIPCFETEVFSVAAFPALPEFSAMLTFVKRVHMNVEYTAGDNLTDIMSGVAMAVNVTNNPITVIAQTDAYGISDLNYPGDTLNLAVWGRYHYYHAGWSEQDPDYFEDSTLHQEWLTSFRVPGIQPENLAICNDVLPCELRDIIVQKDANGLRRIISRSGAAFAWPDFFLLWQRSSFSWQLMFAAPTPNSADERIFDYSLASPRFLLYDAADGSLLDSTSAFVGTPEKVLQLVDGSREIVTRSGSTIRIYGFLPGADWPRRLTIRALAGANGIPLVRLQWLQADGSTNYFVFSSLTPDGPETLCATVPAESTAITLPANQSRAFFRVIAEYSQ